MKITKQELTSKGRKEFDEDIVFNPEEIKDNPLIISINKLHAHVETEYITDLAIVKILLNGNLTLRSTRSLKPVSYDLNEDDEIVFAFNEDTFDSESMVLFEGDELDLDNYLYSMVIASIPLKVLAEDEEEVIEGDNWEIITEDEYYKRKNKDISSSPFAELADMDFDD